MTKGITDLQGVACDSTHRDGGPGALFNLLSFINTNLSLCNPPIIPPLLHISSVVNKTLKADSDALFGMATLIMEPIVADLCRVKGSNDNCDCRDKKAEVTQDLGEKEERAALDNYT